MLTAPSLEVKMTTFSFRVRYARRIPDPILDSCERHVFLCAVDQIPRDLPLDKSNVRPQNTNKRVYKEVAKHLRNENDEGAKNIFHLKNKGITILADDVVPIDKDEGRYQIVFGNEAQGIVDGGHTYRIIIDNQLAIAAKNKLIDENENLTPEDRERLRITQYVKLEILTGLNTSITTEIARGLNTAVQVQEQTLANHAGKFEWIKEDLRNEPCLEKIAFRENEEGLLDAADVIRILELFNITDYPNDGSSRHPIRAYTGKENVLASYLKNSDALLKLRPLLKEILILHDTLSFEARDIWNKSAPKRKGGSLAFIDVAEKGPAFEFPFIKKSGKHRLFRGALFPMLAAFRWMVVEDPETHLARWRGSFDDILALWRTLAVKLLEATWETSDELGRKPDAIGKSSNHWKNLYNELGMQFMRSATK
jgi:hypothetical protein